MDFTSDDLKKGNAEGPPPRPASGNWHYATEQLWRTLQSINEWTRFADANAGAVLTADGVLGTLAAGVVKEHWLRILALTDRIPLAIEHAAAWAKSIELKEIADGLAAIPLGEETGLPPDAVRPDSDLARGRHDSLTRSLDWSFKLLGAKLAARYPPPGQDRLPTGYSVDLSLRVAASGPAPGIPNALVHPSRESKTVRGGVPTPEYDNFIRLDYVQHALTAIDTIVDRFSAGGHLS